MRQATLKPVLIDDKLRRKPWMIRIPPHLSPTGLRQKLFFESESAAMIEANRLKTIQQQVANGPEDVSLGTIADAQRAEDLLKQMGIKKTFLEVVREWKEIEERKHKSRTFQQLKEEWANDPKRDTKSSRYLKTVEEYFNLFKPLHKTLVCDITRRDVADVFDHLKVSRRNAAIRHLAPMFNEAIESKYAEENPFKRGDIIKQTRSEVEIFSNEVVEQYLRDALENDLKLLPYYVIGTFAGLRPEEELTHVRWEDVNLEKGNILVQAEISKTGVRRWVTLCDAAVAWLKLYQTKGGKTTGYIAPSQNRSTMRKFRLKAMARTNISWIQDGMRHTYCSNWLSVYLDVNELRKQSGHTDFNSLQNHYIRGVQKSEAEAFWQIYPPANL